LLLGVVVFTLAAGIFTTIPDMKNFWPSGFCAVMAAILLLPDTSNAQRVQLGILIFLGLGMLVFGATQGAAINWVGVFSQNTGLLTMVLSVGLLKLLMASRLSHEEKLPIGRKAFWHTLLSLSFFGSVINISAPILISDRLTLNRPMDHFTAASVSRVFCACSTWSPFFAGTAVVLTAVNGVTIVPLMLHGFPLLLFVVLAQYTIGVFRHKHKVDNFRGYPLKPESLWVPILLAIFVVLCSWLFPSLSVLVCIAASAIVLTVGTLLLHTGSSNTASTLVSFVTQELPKSVNELQLFVSAGVLAAGLSSLVLVGSLSAPIEEYTAGVAAVVLALMVLFSAMGVHPIIQIVALTSLLLEVDPDPTLLGLTYMFAWGLGTAASPLSGTHLVIQGRYGIVAWKSAMRNWPFVALTYLVAVMLLWISSPV